MSDLPAKLQKKICLLGSFAVGKTSLVRRYVQNLFSDDYKTTIGVKIDKKVVSLPGCDVVLMIWDIAGEDEFHEVPLNYLKGASGYLLVLDGTRTATWPVALDLHRKVRDVAGDVPFLVLANKADLVEDWEFDEAARSEFEALAAVQPTSAKTGQGVEDAFGRLAAMMIPGSSHES